MTSGQARVRLVQVGSVLAAAALIAGCGSQYRPVVTPIGSSGPAPQVSSYAVAVSATPTRTAPGIATIIDYSGDSVLAYAPIGPGPTLFTMDEVGANGYTLNSDGTITNFPISNQLQAKQVTYTTLGAVATTGTPTPPLPPVNIFSPSAGFWSADLSANTADVFTGSPEAFKLSVPFSTAATTPVTIVGPGTAGQYYYALSQNLGATPTGVECNTSPTTGPLGTASGLAVATYTVTSTIPVGRCPVYAVQSSDARRVFVMNRGGDTTVANSVGSISVINSQLNTADSCTPFQNQDGNWVTCHPSIQLPAGPVYAEYNAKTQELVVADYDSNQISVIDMSEDEYGNDYNTYANPTCTVSGVTSYANCGAITGGFGTVIANVPVGNNPASVTVLADGTRAYAANQTDETVSIIDLTDQVVENTLPVNGHPRTVVSTENSLEGKVYVASPDSPYLTIIRTDLDIVDTSILLEGTSVVDVRVSTQNGTTGNNNNVSRVPGYGQPCNLPGSVALATLALCQALP